MNHKIIEKVSEFLSKEFQNKVRGIAIFQHEDGTYEFFNKYYIKEDSTGYQVSFKYSSTVKLFNSLKNAVTWCIFENRNKFGKAQRIEHIDKMISSTELNIQIHKRLIQKSKALESKLIYIAKLNEDQIKRKSYIKEMSDYINESKQWQTQKFATK